MDGPEIALVDHASVIRPWMVRRLQGAGYRVSAYNNRDFKPQVLIWHPPNLLIVNCLASPAAALWRLIGELRAYPDTRHLPIVLCAAAGEPLPLDAEIRHSVWVLRKPFAASALLGLVAAQMPPPASSASGRFSAA